jgi:hypothetical protein
MADGDWHLVQNNFIFLVIVSTMEFSISGCWRSLFPGTIVAKLLSNWGNITDGPGNLVDCVAIHTAGWINHQEQT